MSKTLLKTRCLTSLLAQTAMHSPLAKYSHELQKMVPNICKEKLNKNLWSVLHFTILCIYFICIGFNIYSLCPREMHKWY